MTATPTLTPAAIQSVLATHDEAIRAIAKHQLDLLLQFSELKALLAGRSAPGTFLCYKDLPKLDDDQLEALKIAVMEEESHREAVKATMEAEYEKEARSKWASDRESAEKEAGI